MVTNSEQESRVDYEAVASWAAGLKEVQERIGSHFVRSEPRERAMAYLQGLMSDVSRKNGWQLAEFAGEVTPDGMQRLLNAAKWDEHGVRDELRDYVVEELKSEEAILVVDETGFLKKGTHSVGVKRQYSGTAGRVENCQIGVFLSYTTEHGHALIDRELYLPKDWVADTERRREARVPVEATFHTKPELAEQMLRRAFAAGVSVQWVAGDSIYGRSLPLRQMLEEQKQWYVLGIAKSELVGSGEDEQRIEDYIATFPENEWITLSCGEGAKGPRLYDWLLAPWPREETEEDICHAVLARRSLEDGELAYFKVFAPADTSLETLVRVAGQRWTIEECFEIAKDEVGLDEYEVRHWHAWYRHITLSMFGLAFLTVSRHRAQQDISKKR